MMVGDEYTICPMCGGNDGQGCYGNCPSQEIPKLRAEIERLRDALQTIAKIGSWSTQVTIANDALEGK